MPKKIQKPEVEIEEVFQDKPVSNVLRDNFMPYAMSVIMSRAIPEIDGLKPSHRKILYTMYEMGLLTGIRTKSANVAARTMLLNPHGDAACYEAAVRMTEENETLLAPLIDGKGNFGKHYSRDMAFAASRYTEMKLAPVAGEFFKSIRKNAVDFVDNYDSTRKEPVLLPTTFPNILANPTEGIAVGIASSIPSFNLSELCEATIKKIKNPDADVLDVMPAPDFTTAASILYDEDAMRDIYKTGKGSIKMRAAYSVDTKNRIIEVTEIPYSTTAEAIIEGTIELIKKGKITEIADIRNEIDINGFKIAIDYKRGVDPDQLMKKLFKLTKLQDTYSCNMVVLINGRPLTIGVDDILNEWINWRRECIRRELSFDLEKKTKEMKLLKALTKVLLDIDKAIGVIRAAEDDKAAVEGLMKAFEIDEENAEYVAEIKLRNLNKEYLLTRTQAIEGLEKEIATLNKQIGSDKEIDKVMISELKNVEKKYGRERKTKLVEDDTKEIEEMLSQVKEYDVKLYVTKEGYIKKLAMTSLKTSPEIKTKEGDEIIAEYTTTNTKEILAFTDKFNVYKLQLSEVQDGKPSDMGLFAASLVGAEQDEKVVFITVLGREANLLIAFENGKVARIPMTVYETKLNRKKLVNAYSNLASPAGFVAAKPKDEIVMTDSRNRMLVVPVALIPEKTTKSTQGVQVMKLPAKGRCVSIGVLKDGQENASKYRCQKIPATGKRTEEQLTLESAEIVEPAAE